VEKTAACNNLPLYEAGLMVNEWLKNTLEAATVTLNYAGARLQSELSALLSEDERSKLECHFS